MRPCTCDVCDQNLSAPYTLDQCRHCWLYYHDEFCNLQWGGAGLSEVPRLLTCKHQGQFTGDTINCGSCTGKVRLKTFTCSLHGICTTHTKAGSIACCAACRDYDPNTYSLVAPGGTRDVHGKEFGRLLKKPWHFPVAVCLPHLDSLEQLQICTGLLRAQTIKPYFLVIDTGSTPVVCEQLERMRAPDLEIHYLKGHGWINASAPISAAIDVTMALCRSDHLYCMHTDSFPRRPDLLEWLLSQCNWDSPVVGYGMSDRSWATDLWQKCVGHACLMLHLPRLRQAGVYWNMEHNYRLLNWDISKPTRAWPDTESGFSLDCEAKGVPIKLIGREVNDLRQKDDNIDHCRSWTTSMMYSSVGMAEERKKHMAQAILEAKERISMWSKK